MCWLNEISDIILHSALENLGYRVTERYAITCDLLDVLWLCKGNVSIKFSERTSRVIVISRPRANDLGCMPIRFASDQSTW